MNRIVSSSLLLLMLGCSSAPSQPPDPSSFPAEPFAMVTSSSGMLHLALRSSPQPLAVGNDDLQLEITDAAGTPRDGLAVAVTPWMPAHDHGTSKTTVTPEGGGKYLVTDVYLYMSGVWQLQIAFSGSVSDDASIQFELP
ncbi:MAG TPA: FixH family protein [Polyangiaceae bacterium]